MAWFESKTVDCRLTVEIKAKAKTPVLKMRKIASFAIICSERTFSNTIISRKEEKRDQKAIMEKSSSTLVDPALVTVVGVAKDSQQPSSTPDKETKKRQSSED